MEELPEIHLLPEELEEYSKFSRMMKLLKKLRLRRQADLQAEEAMKALQQGIAPGQQTVTLAPSPAGLQAAPVQPQPEPISQVAMPKPINATLQPLNTESQKMSTRVASAKPNNPFERVMMRKFAALADDGTPSLAEATGIGVAGLAGVGLGHKLAPVGSRWMAQEALGPYLGSGFSELEDIMGRGGFGARHSAMKRLQEAASEVGVAAPRSMWFPTRGRVLNAAGALEDSLTSKLTKSKSLPFKILGGLGAALGAAALIKRHNEGPMAALVGATPADASVGAYAYPEAQMTDMGGQYPGAY